MSQTFYREQQRLAVFMEVRCSHMLVVHDEKPKEHASISHPGTYTSESADRHIPHCTFELNCCATIPVSCRQPKPAKGSTSTPAARLIWTAHPSLQQVYPTQRE